MSRRPRQALRVLAVLTAASAVLVGTGLAGASGAWAAPVRTSTSAIQLQDSAPPAPRSLCPPGTEPNAGEGCHRVPPCAPGYARDDNDSDCHPAGPPPPAPPPPGRCSDGCPPPPPRPASPPPCAPGYARDDNDSGCHPVSPPPAPCTDGPTLSVLDDTQQPATRLVQGETVSLWVTCFGPGRKVLIKFGGETLGEVTDDELASFTLPYDVPGGRDQSFVATIPNVVVPYTVWYDYAPE